PDVDDTSAVLRALGKDAALTEPEVFHKAKAWLLHMQNSDGGFGAFEKDANKKMFQWLPLENAKDALLDESTADLTGRTLYTLRKYCNMSPQHKQIKQCISWLLNNQNNDGAWYGKWGVYYIYGTWAACSGLGSITDNQKVNVALERAQKWLLSVQHDDGGWGESGRSAVAKRYEPLQYSTVVQTAWAMDALLHTGISVQSDAIQRGLQFLLQANNWSGKSVSYPTGLGLPGAFYIRYYSYPYVFPLTTIARVHSLMT
ncbi:MAG: prenyltransferase/squalene oxidase repeat-containing protein, partial [Bacilli bacterium]